MRTTVPPAFTMEFIGPEGPYAVRFRPAGEWDGMIDVSMGGQDMQWSVDEVHREETGGLTLCGMTSGRGLWNDQFWFELRLNDEPPVIRYWGDKVVWREDRAT